MIRSNVFFRLLFQSKAKKYSRSSPPVLPVKMSGKICPIFKNTKFLSIEISGNSKKMITPKNLARGWLESVCGRVHP